MVKNNIIELHCFGKEIGKIGFDEDRNASFFQYNPGFLKENIWRNMFPLIFRRIPQTQVFTKYNNDTFKGLPPMIADSLPDTFGNMIFKAWLESKDHSFKKISVPEQLAYAGLRGMGALEYMPARDMPAGNTIDIDEITAVVTQVLEHKRNTAAPALDHASLINIFKIGTSAGGARPKILVSQHKATGAIIPGDIACSADYDHYLVKLDAGQEQGYSRELTEYVYYLTATTAGIDMMPSKMIDGRHFATLRYDRQHGRKNHVLTASGLTGWDFTDPAPSSYENLFDLALHLKLLHKDIEQLFRRMVFNLIFANHDDHLKNHSFLYREATDKWELAPAYDLTYSLNPLPAFTRVSRALSVNGKRMGINLADVLSIAEKYTIRNAAGIIEQLRQATAAWPGYATAAGMPATVIAAISSHFTMLR